MKHLYLLILSFLIIGSTLAQEVRSGDFENWVKRESYSLEDFNTFGEVKRSEDSEVGSYAIRLENIDNPVDDQFGLITNAQIGDKILGGQAYDESPLSLRFFAKYDLATGDAAQVLTLFKLNGNIIGSASVFLEGSSNDTFLKFSVPIVWQVSALPDTVVFVAASRDLDEDTVNGNGFVILDDIHFTTISKRHKELNNGDFENWSANGVEVPKDWFTVDDFYAELGFPTPYPLVSKSTDAHGGKYSMLLRNIEQANDFAPGIAASVLDMSRIEKPGFPVNRNWKFLEGWYKYETNGDDSMNVNVVMYKLGVPISLGMKQSNKSVSDWTYFTVPLTYLTDLVIADSATLILASCNPDEARSGDTKLWIDDLKFTDNPLSVFERTRHKLGVYPNPFEGDIQLDGIDQITGTEFQLINVNGVVVQQGIIGKNKEIAVRSDLNRGVYFLNLNGEKIKFSKMLMKK
mgnify:FL=1